MDIEYGGISFVYDDYACERFKRNLVDSLDNLQRKYAIRESMIKSLEDLNGWIFQIKLAIGNVAEVF